MIRVKGLIAVVVLLAVGFAGWYFLTDGFVEELIEDQASQVNGALVEIDNLSLDLINLQASWDRIQVTNPDDTWENLFETGKAEFNVNPWPFVFGNKVVIENMQLSSLRINSERETDGYIEKKVKESEVKEDSEPGFVEEIGQELTNEIKANAQAKFDGISSNINADSLVAALDLVTLTRVDSLTNALNVKYSYWYTTFGNFNLKKDADKIQKTALAIDPNKIKDVPTATKAIDNVKLLTKQVDSLKVRIETVKNDFGTDLKNISGSAAQVDDWVQSDYDRAASLAKLPKIDAQNIGQTLFGEELLGDFQTYLGYASTARTYLNRLKGEEEEKIERFKGKDYQFSDKYEYPGLWIQNIELSGFTNKDFELGGKITDITSDQEMVGRATMIDLKGVDQDQVGVVVIGELNYLGEDPMELFEAKYQNFSLVNQKLSPSALVPYDIATGSGTISASLDIIDRRIKSEVSYQTAGLSFDFEKAGASKSRLESLVRSAISSTDAIDATAIVDGTAGKLNLKVRSNIDDLFLNALRSTISKEVDDAKRKIQAEVDKQVSGKKAEVEELIASKEKELRAEYDRLEKEVNDQLAIVDQKQKELEAKKKEIEDRLKKDALNKLKKKIGF